MLNLIHLDTLRDTVETKLGYEVKLARETKGRELIAFVPKTLNYSELYIPEEDEYSRFYVCLDAEGVDITDKVVAFIGTTPVLYGGMLQYTYITDGYLSIGDKMYTDPEGKINEINKLYLEELGSERVRENINLNLQKEFTPGTHVIYNFNGDNSSGFTKALKYAMLKDSFHTGRRFTSVYMNEFYHQAGFIIKSINVTTGTVTFQGHSGKARLRCLTRA